MGSNKEYAGYKSFQYLEPGVDYVTFELAKEIGRVEPYVYPVNESEEELVQQLLKESIVISTHDHPVLFPADIHHVFEYNRQGRWFTAYEGLSVSHLDAVFDNLMDGIATITSKHGWKWNDIVFDIGMRLSDIAHQDFVIRAERVEDILNAHEAGKCALVLTLESLSPIENEIDRIDVLYGLGIRSMGICYSESNMLGSGMRENQDGGLTALGHEAVDRMNKLGVAIDISHAGDQSSLDVIEASKTPIFMSHAGARALWDTPRMKPDEVLQALAEKGGIIGVEAAPHTTLTKKHPEHGIEAIMEHFEHCVELMGLEHVGFGPDTLYGDHVGLHHVFAAHLSMSRFQVRDQEQPEESEYVKGAENPSECFPNIVRWLVKHGYSNEEIKKVIGENALRVLKAAWGL
ncbi:MAG: dipeptidase [Candidatus Heimdallarchaeota archaeon]